MYCMYTSVFFRYFHNIFEAICSLTPIPCTPKISFRFGRRGKVSCFFIDTYFSALPVFEKIVSWRTGVCLYLELLRLLNLRSGDRDIIDELPAALSMTVDSCIVEVLKLISVALSPPCYRSSISYRFLQKSMRDINLLSYPLFSPSILA